MGFDLNSFVDGLIEPFSPRTAVKRMAFRQALDAQRQYDAASPSRRTANWRRSGASANTEVRRGLVGLRNGSREMVRNNKYAATAIRLLTAFIWGDGVGVILKHPDPKIQKAARLWFDTWARSPVDGRNDFYGVGKLAVRAWKESGESLLVWSSSPNGYLDRVRVLEGDYLDYNKNGKNGLNNIVQGVEFDPDGFRVAYWLFDTHPGEAGMWGPSRRYSAEFIDHVFDEQRPGQARGVPVLAPVMLDLKDIGDVEDAKTMQEKVAACVGLVLSSQDDSPPPAVGNVDEPKAPANGRGPEIETIRPGAIIRVRANDGVTTLTPPATNGGVEFNGKRVMAISAATGLPHFMLSGDPSHGNYSSQRGQMLPFWSLLDDEQQNIVVPTIPGPAVRRRMYALYLATGDARFMEVTAEYSMPMRRALDPRHDLAGEVGEVRAGFKTHRRALADRGTTLEEYIADKVEEQTAFDKAGVVTETDVRKVTDSGILQAPSALALPKKQQEN